MARRARSRFPFWNSPQPSQTAHSRVARKISLDNLLTVMVTWPVLISSISDRALCRLPSPTLSPFPTQLSQTPPVTPSPAHISKKQGRGGYFRVGLAGSPTITSFVFKFFCTFLHFSAFFCTSQKTIPLIFNRFHALSAKRPGVGCLDDLGTDRVSLPSLCATSALSASHRYLFPIYPSPHLAPMSAPPRGHRLSTVNCRLSTHAAAAFSFTSFASFTSSTSVSTTKAKRRGNYPGAFTGTPRPLRSTPQPR
jgi:hypothetical protein